MKNKDTNAPDDKEGLNMNATIQEYGCLDLSKLRTRASKIISTEEALQDITPIDWSNDVLTKNKMVHVTKTEKNDH